MSTHSSIKNKKRIVIKNPDGTYSYLFKDGEVDSVIDKKDKSNDELCQNQDNLNNLSLSDEELQFLIDHADQFDYHSLIDQILDIFRNYRILFFLLLTLELCIMSSLLFNTFKNKENSVTMMEEIYKDLNAEEASLFFNGIFCIVILLNAGFYPLGYYALIEKKVKLLKHFSLFALYTAIATIFIIYINVLFVFAFVLRLILYGFSRFLVNLLVSIILIPNRHPQAQIQNQDYGSLA